MNDAQKNTATECLIAAETDMLAFPQIVGRLIDVGFECYSIDFRRATATYYLANGESIELSTHRIATAVSERFDAAALQTAIREAQTPASDYSYKGFCEKAAAAGCAAYLVSFAGRRALYMGRSAETHTEHFPQ